MNIMLMETESPSGRRSQEAREAKRFSNTRKYDSQGRGFVRTYNISLSENCDRRSQLRDQSRFQREPSGSRQSRLGKFERDKSQRRENRSSQSSKDRKEEFNRCFVCKFKICKDILTKINSIAVNLAKKDTEVNMCEI